MRARDSGYKITCGKFHVLVTQMQQNYGLVFGMVCHSISGFQRPISCEPHWYLKDNIGPVFTSELTEVVVETN